MSLESRLRKLEQAAGGAYAPGECPNKAAVGALLVHEKGKPLPPIPEDAPRCSLCGQVHVASIVEVEVGTNCMPFTLFRAVRASVWFFRICLAAGAVVVHPLHQPPDPARLLLCRQGFPGRHGFVLGRLVQLCHHELLDGRGGYRPCRARLRAPSQQKSKNYLTTSFRRLT
jgi:hypothetical protein